ncbi:hypothetical protein [Nonomuraea recticatena]|uniref:hypothetical protein n=1 Tax=Nonomuraea recticatena TaxID=46178 RepID=UPI00361F082A
MVAPRLISCTLAVAMLALTACTSTVQGQGEPTPSGASPSTGEATPAALTADAYRQALGEHRDGVREALSQVASAKSIKTLDARVERAEETLRGASESLSALAPPWRPESSTRRTSPACALSPPSSAPPWAGWDP